MVSVQPDTGEDGVAVQRAPSTVGVLCVRGSCPPAASCHITAFRCPSSVSSHSQGGSCRLRELNRLCRVGRGWWVTRGLHGHNYASRAGEMLLG